MHTTVHYGGFMKDLGKNGRLFATHFFINSINRDQLKKIIETCKTLYSEFDDKRREIRAEKAKRIRELTDPDHAWDAVPEEGGAMSPTFGGKYTRVSVQGVKSLGGDFACLCRGFEFYEVKKKIVIIFQKENGNTFTLLIIFIVKSLQKEQNSTNLLL